MFIVITLLATASSIVGNSRSKKACLNYVECMRKAHHELQRCSGGTALALSLESMEKGFTEMARGREKILIVCQDSLLNEILDFDTLQVLVNDDARECFNQLPINWRMTELSDKCDYMPGGKRYHFGKDVYQCFLEFRTDRQRCERLFECCPEHTKCGEKLNTISMAYQHAKMKSLQIVSKMLHCIASNDPSSSDIVTGLEKQKVQFRIAGIPFLKPDKITEERIYHHLNITSYEALKQPKNKFDEKFQHVKARLARKIQNKEEMYMTSQQVAEISIERRLAILKNLLRDADESDLMLYIALIAHGDFVKLSELEAVKEMKSLTDERMIENMNKSQVFRDEVKGNDHTLNEENETLKLDTRFGREFKGGPMKNRTSFTSRGEFTGNGLPQLRVAFNSTEKNSRMIYNFSSPTSKLREQNSGKLFEQRTEFKKENTNNSIVQKKTNEKQELKSIEVDAQFTKTTMHVDSKESSQGNISARPMNIKLTKFMTEKEREDGEKNTAVNPPASKYMSIADKKEIVLNSKSSEETSNTFELEGSAIEPEENILEVSSRILAVSNVTWVPRLLHDDKGQSLEVEALTIFQGMKNQENGTKNDTEKFNEDKLTLNTSFLNVSFANQITLLKPKESTKFKSEKQNYCSVYANCEETVQYYEEQCNKRYANELIIHGTDEAEILQLLMNSSASQNDVVLKSCLLAIENSVLALKQLFIVLRGVRKACIEIAVFKPLINSEADNCSTSVPVSTLVDEYLSSIHVPSEKNRLTCLTKLAPLKAACRTTRKCCSNVEVCDNYINSSPLNQMKEKAMEQLIKRQNDCEKKVLETLIYIYAKLEP